MHDEMVSECPALGDFPDLAFSQEPTRERMIKGALLETLQHFF